MIYTEFQGDKLPLLGFGAMRLPTREDGKIDEAKTAEMVAYAMEHGVNYFDTAYPYHGGQSERVMGRILAKYPRESFRLASKYPGHQLAPTYNPAEIFEEQLEKCGVEYFDYYLLHNVYEKSIEVYTDPKWGMLAYFIEQKRLGRIRHLGFSSHGNVENLRAFLDYAGDAMEFCQIQLNYVDWTLQNAAAKCALLAERGIPVWVMEPVRGGKLVSLSEADTARLAALRPDESPAAWAFRFVQEVPGVQMILSGMSNMAQMQENVATFAARRPLSDAERAVIMEIGAALQNSVPCTACRYCTDGCPMGLDIPALLAIYNDMRFGGGLTTAMRTEAFPEDKRPSACIACGACTAACPQKIDIPAHLADYAERMKKLPSWDQICRERAEAAARGRMEK